jgi:hypothetical protein
MFRTYLKEIVYCGKKNLRIFFFIFRFIQFMLCHNNEGLEIIKLKKICNMINIKLFASITSKQDFFMGIRMAITVKDKTYE